MIFPALRLVVPWLAWLGLGSAQGNPDYELPPVAYSATRPVDALTKIQRRIESGEIAFRGGEKEAVRALLVALHVPVESQMLVFSKTSLQRGRIRPERPRALYFSASVYVGWVPGGLMEVTAVDPTLGPIFYTVDFSAGREVPPKIERDADCLRCHGGNFIRDIPGVFARSVFSDAGGEPLLRHGTLLVDDETPFSQRWGGWYVTGYRGAEPHRGNTFASEQGDQLVFTPVENRPEELSGFFETGLYLRPTSDVVALLVFEHQLAVQNSLTRAAFSCRRMINYQHGLQATFNEPVSDEPAYDSVKSVFASAVQDVVDRLLFRGAAPLPEGIVAGGEFEKAFARSVPRTRAGQSLGELRLKGQLFAQRCSHMIYTAMFRALPDPLRFHILDRLQAALASRDPKDRYAYLPAEEKQRIHDVLVETLPEARERWRVR
ncbi:MAG: hypothetical protein ABIQ12_06740 [Opitutaceae bacterium]